jgi:hypothetical protein
MICKSFVSRKKKKKILGNKSKERKLNRLNKQLKRKLCLSNNRDKNLNLKKLKKNHADKRRCWRRPKERLRLNWRRDNN